MKKPFIIFSAFILVVSFIVYSCNTKNDPAVPNHVSNISSSNNSITLIANGATYTFNLGYHNCGDTSADKHYSMSGKEMGSNFIISAIFYDSLVPKAISTYTIVSPVTSPVLSVGQCYIVLQAPTISSSLYVATTGFLNYDPNIINPKVTASNIPIVNLGDSTKTATISGNWICQ
jgi:hypothetical protein